MIIVISIVISIQLRKVSNSQAKILTPNINTYVMLERSGYLFIVLVVPDNDFACYVRLCYVINMRNATHL